MHARWNRWVDTLRTGFWFVPMVMLGLSGALALVLLYVDQRVDPGIKTTLAWAYTGGPEGARTLLSTIAGSMITASTVTFSLAAVALSIASQQYGSRVLRNFMRDRVMQVLLGTFVATFLYSVLVVRAIRGTTVGGGFVPAISVTVGIALALVSLILLIYFIHHISASIQASQVVRVIAEDMEAAIPRLYPSETGEPPADRVALEGGQQRQWTPLLAAKSGYLQTTDLNLLMRVATEQDVVIELGVKPGDHLIEGREMARAWGAKELPEEALARAIGAFHMGRERTPAQDIRYQFQQLTDVVVRALSPGINDPFTAINGIDEMETGMALLAQRARVADQRQDKEGVLRLIAPTAGVSEVLEHTVGHVAIYGAGDRFVMARLRRVLDTVEGLLRDEREMATLSRLREELDRRERAEAMG
ncbi:MAG: DUF2254 domain-containing protein [Acidobacteriaceae bacterium]